MHAFVCVHICVCVRACVFTSVHVCMRACVLACPLACVGERGRNEQWNVLSVGETTIPFLIIPSGSEARHDEEDEVLIGPDGKRAITYQVRPLAPWYGAPCI